MEGIVESPGFRSIDHRHAGLDDVLAGPFQAAAEDEPRRRFGEGGAASCSQGARADPEGRSQFRRRRGIVETFIDQLGDRLAIAGDVGLGGQILGDAGHRKPAEHLPHETQSQAVEDAGSEWSRMLLGRTHIVEDREQTFAGRGDHLGQWIQIVTEQHRAGVVILARQGGETQGGETDAGQAMVLVPIAWFDRDQVAWCDVEFDLVEETAVAADQSDDDLVVAMLVRAGLVRTGTLSDIQDIVADPPWQGLATTCWAAETLGMGAELALGHRGCASAGWRPWMA